MEAEKKDISDEIKDIYREAKGNGFDTKIIRKVIALRKQDADDRANTQALVDTYMHALGALADTPLGQAAVSLAIAEL
jgi:uncharacterized protein (UPF0335 family)